MSEVQECRERVKSNCQCWTPRPNDSDSVVIRKTLLTGCFYQGTQWKEETREGILKWSQLAASSVKLHWHGIFYQWHLVTLWQWRNKLNCEHLAVEFVSHALSTSITLWLLFHNIPEWGSRLLIVGSQASSWSVVWEVTDEKFVWVFSTRRTNRGKLFVKRFLGSKNFKDLGKSVRLWLPWVCKNVESVTSVFWG